MSNFNPDGIKKLVERKEKELYYGEIVLHFKAGKITIIEYRMTEIADEEIPDCIY